LGYGFDDPANKYTPDVYLSVWKRFHERIQAKGAALSGEAVSKGSTNVALIWESSSCENSIVDWYPGDEFVDWVGTVYGECAEEVIQFAREHFKPVMLTATPTSSQSDWNEWFAPFFMFVNDNNDVVRAVTYINAGESRLLNDDIIKSWKTETKQSFWLRGGPDLFGELGFVE
jgi:hypothetical protein